MKIRLGELELARSDPSEYLRLQGPEINHARNMTHARVLQGAVLDFHRNGTLESASAYLSEMYFRHFGNERKYEELVEKLDLYATAYADSGMTNLKVRDHMVFALNSDLIITGQVPSIELTPDGGYAAMFFLSNPSDSWFEELRFALVQYHYAKSFGVSLDEVVVGMYGFKSGSYEFVQSPKASVAAALRETVMVAKKIERLAR